MAQAQAEAVKVSPKNYSAGARVGDGTPGPGRPKGSLNRANRYIRDALIEAADEVGFDGRGKDGAKGYFRWLARKHPTSFAPLIGKLLPQKVEGDFSVEHQHRHALAEAALEAIATGAADGETPRLIDGQANSDNQAPADTDNQKE